MSLWCLVLSPDNNAHAYNLPHLTTSFTSKIKGLDIIIEPDDDENNNIKLRELVTIGVEQAYSLFEREGLVAGGGTALFNFDNFQHNIVGHSADLAFAIATITHSIKITTSNALISATGKLDEQGNVQSVNGVPAKLKAGLSVIKEEGIIFFPAANIDEITDEIKTVAAEHHVELCPVTHLYDVFVKLGIKVTKMCFAEPYLGLQPYKYEHRSIYSGRVPEIIKVREKLIERAKNDTPGVMIIAASGAGKSSFVQAGLIPSLVLDNEWLEKRKKKNETSCLGCFQAGCFW